MKIENIRQGFGALCDSFERRVGLPVDAARADYRNGVLCIELPKAASAAPLSLNVRVG